MRTLPSAEANPGRRLACVCPKSAMRDPSAGMSFLEIMLVAAIAVILMAIAVPSGFKSVGNYQLHADSTALASYLNLVRMRACSQYLPYSLDVNPTTNTYVVEQLAPITYNPIPTAAPTTPSYSSQSPPFYEYGTQYLTAGETVADCLPAGSTAFPAPVSANPATCNGSFQVYFNTQGFPVDSTGSALASGGLAIYLTSPDSRIDAVTVSSGGAVQTWYWNAGTSQWSAR